MLWLMESRVTSLSMSKTESFQMSKHTGCLRKVEILLEVADKLNLPGPQVQQFYIEYLNMRQMHKLVTPEQIMKLIRMSDSVQTFQEKLEQS
jgi:hypothetical protein